MAKINSTKLLPPAKTSSALVVREGRVKISSAITPIDSRSSALVKNEKDINNKLVKIEKFFQSDLIISRKKAEEKRKEKEKQDFESAEKKLELPKVSGFKLPKFFDAPKLGFFDRVKRFLLFTALGWLFPKIIDFLPKLEGIVNVIGKVVGFAGDIFGKLLDGFTTFVSFGIDLKTKTLGFIAEHQKGDYQKNFDKLEREFNRFTDLSIIAGLLAVDIGAAAIDEINRWKKTQKPGKPGVSERRSGKPPVTTGRGGKKGLGRGVTVTEGKGGKPPSLWKRLTSKFKLPSWMEKISSKLKVGPFAKLSGPLKKFLGAAVPFAGAAIGELDARSRFASGDNVGGWLARTSAILDGFAGGVALTGLGFFSSIIAAPVGAFLEAVAGVATGISMVIDAVLLVRDILNVFGVKTFSRGGRVVNSYQKGGTTRAGKSVNAPSRRTYTPVRRKPFKVSPQKSQPGKNVGGEGKIKKLYPDTDTKRAAMSLQEWMESGKSKEGKYSDYLKEQKEKDQEDRPNPYFALTSTSTILKKLSLEGGRIPGVPNSRDAVGYLMNGIGGLMGAAVDAALGQKTDPKVFKSFSSGIGYLVDTLANQRVGASLSGFANGGSIAPSRELKTTYESLSSGDLISKVIGPSIEERINEAIQKVQNEVRKKVKEETDTSGGGGEPGMGVGDDTNAGKVFNAFIAEGFTPNQAAGVVGNLMQESGGGTKNLSPTASNNIGNGHYGIAQWDKKNRWPAVSAYIRSIGKDPNSIDGQIAGLIWELKNKERPSYDALKKAKSAEQAAIVWLNKFERSGEVPGQAGFDNRVLYASRIAKEFAERGTIGGAVDSKNPILAKLGTTNLLVNAGAGACTASVAFTMDKNNVYLEPGGTTQDYGNNPRALQVKLSRSGWVSLKIGSPITLNSPLGRANAFVMTHGQYVSAVNLGQIPSGALVFQTMNSSWNGTSPNSHGFDSAIARNGGRNLFNGKMYGNSIYGSATKFVIVWVPKGSVSGASPQSQQQSQQPPNPPGKPQSQAQASQRPQRQGRLNTIQNVLTALSKRGEYIPFEHDGKKFVFKVFPNLSMVVWPSTPFNNKLPNPLPLFGGRRIEISSPEFKKLLPSIREKINSMYTLPQVEGKQDGGLISPSKPNRSVPNSFASYETYGSGMMIAIQPIIVEKTVPVHSEKMIAFPVAVAVNSNNNLSLSRG